MSYKHALAEWVTEPLAKVVGKSLEAVTYYVIDDPFDPQAPNDSGGCQGIHLRFDTGEVELDWGWNSELKREQDAYHLMARTGSERQACVQPRTAENPYALIAVFAKGVWSGVIGETLLAVTMSGHRIGTEEYSPQVVHFAFPSTVITIAIGWTDTDELIIGDGDDVLVFGQEEWSQRNALNIFGEEMIPFWKWPSNDCS